MFSVFNRNHRQLNSSETSASGADRPETSAGTGASSDAYTKEIQDYIRQAAARSAPEAASAQRAPEALSVQDQTETVVESSDEVPAPHPDPAQKKPHHMKHFRRDYQTDSYTSKIQEYFRQKNEKRRDIP